MRAFSPRFSIAPERGFGKAMSAHLLIIIIHVVVNKKVLFGFRQDHVTGHKHTELRRLPSFALGDRPSLVMALWMELLYVGMVSNTILLRLPPFIFIQATKIKLSKADSIKYT